MLAEQQNFHATRPSEQPPEFGLTYVVEQKDGSAQEVLARIKEVWHAVAGWGRWPDEDLGDWPSVDECIQSLPDWFVFAIRSLPKFEIENWMQDLHDRSWVWWSGAIVDGLVKLDLSVDSMPAAFWPFELVIEKAGGNLLYIGPWKDAETVLRDINAKNP